MNIFICIHLCFFKINYIVETYSSPSKCMNSLQGNIRLKVHLKLVVTFRIPGMDPQCSGVGPCTSVCTYGV